MKRILSMMAFLSAIVAVLLVAQPVSAQITTTDLGTLPRDTYSEAAGINDLGQVVGYSYYYNVPILGYDATLWNASTEEITTLGKLSGGSSNVASGINNLGQIVGYTYYDYPLSYRHATLWNASTGEITDLGALPGGTFSVASSINDLGQIVGVSINESGKSHATLWNASTGEITDLGTFPGDTYSSAYDINDLGQIVGVSINGPGKSHATLWNASTGEITNLGTLPGGTYSVASSINNLGQIVGYSNYTLGNYNYHATLWNASTGEVTDLGTLPGGTYSVATSINNLGQIVGYSDSASGPRHATLWNASTGEITDLGTLPGGTFSVAYGINDLGQIVGYSSNESDSNSGHTGYRHAALWNVIVSDNIAPITAISLSGTAGTNGWNISDVQVTLTATDEGGSGVAKTEYRLNGADWITYTGPFAISEEGTTAIEYNSTDNAGNIEPTKTQTVKIDKTLPQITINTPIDGSEYLLNQPLITDWSASDAVSDIASATGTYPNGSTIDTASVGTQTFSVDAIDNAGNANTKRIIYYIRYKYSGILQPINADGSSIFKLGSTVPVKFQLQDASGSFVTNTVAKIYMARISDGIIGTEMEANSTSNATAGNLFRYSNTTNEYIFNLGTKSLSIGTWQIRIELNDGTSKYVTIGLK